MKYTILLAFALALGLALGCATFKKACDKIELSTYVDRLACPALAELVGEPLRTAQACHYTAKGLYDVAFGICIATGATDPVADPEGEGN